jgi:hypothetical protein
MPRWNLLRHQADSARISYLSQLMIVTGRLIRIGFAMHRNGVFSLAST